MMTKSEARAIARTLTGPLRFALRALSKVTQIVPDAADELLEWMDEATREPAPPAPRRVVVGPLVCSMCHEEVPDESSAVNLFPFGALCSGCYERVRAEKEAGAEEHSP